MAAKITSRGKTPKTIEVLLRNVGIVKKQALLILEGTTADKSRKFGKKYRFRSEKP